MQYDIVPISSIPQEASATPDNLTEIYEVCQQMADISEREKGIGCSAFQIGIPWRVFVIKEPNGYEHYIDCDYEPVGTDKQSSIEGCLSLRGQNGKLRRYKVQRYKSIRVVGKCLVVRDGKLELVPIDFISSGDIFTIAFQHEIDHSFGISRLLSEIGEEVDIW